jgi:hypothetical protein
MLFIVLWCVFCCYLFNCSAMFFCTCKYNSIIAEWRIYIYTVYGYHFFVFTILQFLTFTTTTITTTTIIIISIVPVSNNRIILLLSRFIITVHNKESAAFIGPPVKRLHIIFSIEIVFNKILNAQNILSPVFFPWPGYSYLLTLPYTGLYQYRRIKVVVLVIA